MIKIKQPFILVLSAFMLLSCEEAQESTSASSIEETPSSEIVENSSESEETDSEEEDTSTSSKEPIGEEGKTDPEDKTNSEMLSFLKEKLETEVGTLSTLQYSFERQNLPYKVGYVFENSENFEENILTDGKAIATGNKKTKTTTAEGEVTKNLDVDYLKKYDSDDTYYYEIKDYDSTTKEYGFTDEAKRTKKTELEGESLSRAKGEFISAYALDIIGDYFSPTSSTLTSLPSFKKSEADGKKTYTAKASVANSGSGEEGNYHESYYYEIQIGLDAEENVASFTAKKSWQYFLDDSGSTEPNKYQYDTYSLLAEYGQRKETSEKDLNVLDYFLTSYEGIQLLTYKNPSYEEIDVNSAERGVYISAAYATNYLPAKAADTHLIPISSSDESVIKLDKTCNNFFINRVYGEATLTFESVTGIRKTITVTTKEGKEAPTRLSHNQLQSASFFKNVQDYGDEEFIYTGRTYEGLKINIYENQKYDDQIDFASSDDSIASITETSVKVNDTYTSRIYSVTPKKPGKVKLSWYAKQNHDVKLEYDFTVKKGLTAEELKKALVGSTWTFSDSSEAQTIEISFTDKKATLKNILQNETLVITANYTIDDYKISFDDGWYNADGEETYAYGEGEMSMAGDNIRFYISEGAAISGDLFNKKA